MVNAKATCSSPQINKDTTCNVGPHKDTTLYKSSQYLRPLFRSPIFTLLSISTFQLSFISLMAGTALSQLNSNPALHSISRLNPIRPSKSYRPMTVIMAHNSSYWASIDSDIDAHLKKSIPIKEPVSVFEPMHHLTFAAPRTTAAALCVAACELVGGSQSDAVASASALHLMHAAAFTHQHLPLTDRPRPGPAIHHQFKPNIELLTGDGIVPFGLELLARSVDPVQNNSDRILRVIIEITRAVGSNGMVEGLYEEMKCGQSESDMGRVEYVCEKKEGELHACGAACGAILGGGSEEEIEKLRKFGLYAGMIQGMLYGVGKNKEGKMEVVEKLRKSAIKELEHFDSRKVEAISSLVEAQLVNA